ncbi:unnamed protein product [Psylliodes chrysocephalus]|uniref:Mutator-like transposase domain-containing protein n=1 Tax=Psylliodes chrysocephalus TaxID=3402493 RepID=A0A9P0CH33_9CUCU|nr:unnamed protein product [Psylliodes chrysocephala]
MGRNLFKGKIKNIATKRKSMSRRMENVRLHKRIILADIQNIKTSELSLLDDSIDNTNIQRTLFATSSVLSPMESQPGCSFWDESISKSKVDSVNNSQGIHLEVGNSNEVTLSGRRIVDINYVFKQILSGKKHTPFDCSISDMKVINEFRNGYISTFMLQCKMCNIIEQIHTEDPGNVGNDTDILNINSAITLGAISTGIGYSTLEEMFAAINMPSMAEKKKTKSSSKNCLVPIVLRKELEKNSKRLRICINKAIKHRIAEDIPMVKKIEYLRKDILNVPSHVFGEHAQCKEIKYFKCSETNKPETNLIPAMTDCGLYRDIHIFLNRLLINVDSLIADLDTNVAEHYNSVVCKFVGGKRVNFSKRRSYQSRCEAACISFNKGADYYGSIHKNYIVRSPNIFTQKYMEKVNRRRMRYREMKKQRKARRQLLRSKRENAPADKHYGATAENIYFDEAFWKTMLKKLEIFYFKCILPELLDSRMRRGLEMRKIFLQGKENICK